MSLEFRFTKPSADAPWSCVVASQGVVVGQIALSDEQSLAMDDMLSPVLAGFSLLIPVPKPPRGRKPKGKGA